MARTGIAVVVVAVVVVVVMVVVVGANGIFPLDARMWTVKMLVAAETTTIRRTKPKKRQQWNPLTF